MRILFPLVLIIFIFLQKKYKDINFYKYAMIAYFLFLSFRYMQGTDYVHYFDTYIGERPLNLVLTNGFHNSQYEPLYNLLVSIFRMMGMPFSIFVVFLSGTTLCFFNRFFKLFSDNKLISLLLLYLLYGIVFMESALRQSLAMSIILGVSFVAVYQKNVKQLVLGSILALFIHRSSILISVLLIAYYWIDHKFGIPCILKWIGNNYKKVIVLVVIMFLVINVLPLKYIFAYVPGALGHKLQVYFSSGSFSLLSLVIRLYLLGLVIYFIYRKNFEVNEKNILLLVFYIVGSIAYIVLCKFAIISRLTAYFEILEVVIFVSILMNQQILKHWIDKTLLLSYCGLGLLLFVKDGIVTQKQTGYKKVEIICPYYSHFDKIRADRNIVNIRKLGESCAIF